MRDIVLLLIVFAGVIATFRYPFIGILMWAWITLMVPHQQTFGFARSFPINLIVAVVTIVAWLLSRSRKVPPFDATLVFTICFLFWITANGFQAVDPQWSWPLWDRTWRIILLGLLVSITATSRVRIHALIMVVALSLLFYGVKGGLFTLLTGGHSHVTGPPNSTIGDNNQLALAILMVLPLVNYLRLHSSHILLRRGLLAAMILSLFSVLGSYSRGAFLALAGLLVIAWLRAKNKWIYPFVAAAVMIPAIAFMPATYFERLGTIENAQQDTSFEGREVAWRVAYSYARDHFPFGAGFSGVQLPQVFGTYAPGEETHAAHSIFFEVLGDNGFLGLAIYIAILASAFWNSLMIRKLARSKPELAWAFDLAGMLQLTLVVFCIGGAALSFSYYDLVFIATGLLSVMRLLVQRSDRTVQSDDSLRSRSQFKLAEQAS